MKTPRKILSVCLSFLLIAMITVSGTLAYKTIQQNIVISNEQTGELKVSLVKSGDVSGNQANFQLLPIREGLSKDEILNSDHFVEHKVSVENEGDFKAYVRIVFAFPCSLDSVNEQGNKALHVVESGLDGWDCSYKKNINIGTEPYNFYIYTYKEPISAGDKTPASAMAGFYLDSKVTNNSQGYFLDGKQLNVDQNGKFIFYTRAQASSASGFTSAEDAFESIPLPNFVSQQIN